MSFNIRIYLEMKGWKPTEIMKVIFFIEVSKKTKIQVQLQACNKVVKLHCDLKASMRLLSVTLYCFKVVIILLNENVI